MLSDWEDETDICHYTKCVLFGLLKTVLAAGVLLAFAAILLLVIASVITGLYYFIFSSLTISEVMNHSGFIGFSGVWASVFLLGLVILSLVYGLAWAQRAISAKLHPTTPKPPGFIRSAFRSWKDKTCFKIKFTEE
jgi:hypothetical protein